MRYEAETFDANDVCFTYPITYEPGKDFEVDYSITSDDIIVHMNLRSIANNSILRRRLLPAKFEQLYEYSRNLSEPYDIEFCASSEIIDDDTDASTPASAVISYVFWVWSDSGWWLLF